MTGEDVHFFGRLSGACYNHLSDSYIIFSKTGRLDGISFVGHDLGSLLCQAGQSDEGLEILKRSYDGFLKLGQSEMANQVEALINQFDSQGDP